tara:strand:- start:19735 stop:20043 length:309 start_codon:yes stop_codon:yes gene_type:complete
MTGDTRNLATDTGATVRLTLAEWVKLLTVVIGTVVTVTVSVAHSVGEIREAVSSLRATMVATQQATADDRQSLRTEIQYLRNRIDALPSSAGSSPPVWSPPR